MTTTHTDSLDINISLTPPFPALLGFGKLLLLELAADNSSGSTVKQYKESELDTIETEWTSAIKNAAEVWFDQDPSPTRILIGEWDKVGGDTVSQALDKIIASNPDFFWVASTIRTGTDQEKISSEVESRAPSTKPMVYMLASDDDSIVTSNDLSSSGSDLASVPTREYTFLDYHTSSTEYVGAAHAGKIAPFDPDDKSAPFFGKLESIAAYGSLPAGADIGTAQSEGNIRKNNANAVLPFGSAEQWLAPGQNANGRQGKIILTKFWFQDRIQAEVANEIQTAEKNGEIIPIGAVGESETVGQKRMEKIVRQKYELGAAHQHFLPENLNIDFPTIQQSDIDAGIIPLEAQATVAIGGQAVTFDINFVSTPV